LFNVLALFGLRYFLTSSAQLESNMRVAMPSGFPLNPHQSSFS
jgi:hypothetical protein